jgi:hypothetical protein
LNKRNASTSGSFVFNKNASEYAIQLVVLSVKNGCDGKNRPKKLLEVWPGTVELVFLSLKKCQCTPVPVSVLELMRSMVQKYLISWQILIVQIFLLFCKIVKQTSLTGFRWCSLSRPLAVLDDVSCASIVQICCRTSQESFQIFK